MLKLYWAGKYLIPLTVLHWLASTFGIDTLCIQFGKHLKQIQVDKILRYDHVPNITTIFRVLTITH
jgi:hypothetical protein